MNHVEITKKLSPCGCEEKYQVRLYGHHPHNYISAFKIEKPTGALEGELNSLAGNGFYEFIGPHIRAIYEACQVQVLTAEVLASHWRLLTFKLRRYARAEITGSRTSAEGREFTLFRLTAKEP